MSNGNGSSSRSAPDTAARFVHDPSGGEELADRLDVGRLPDESSVADLGTLSAARQRDDLRQLALLASAATPTSAEPSRTEAPIPAAATTASWQRL